MYKRQVRADRAGYVAAIDGRALGILAMELGAGRKSQTDVLDLGVGIRVRVQVGQRVAAGDIIYEIHAKAGATPPLAAYQATLTWSEEPLTQAPWLLATLGC